MPWPVSITPASLKVFDSGTDGGRAYLVMELVEGESLSKALAAKRLIGGPSGVCRKGGIVA